MIKDYPWSTPQLRRLDVPVRPCSRRIDAFAELHCHVIHRPDIYMRVCAAGCDTRWRFTVIWRMHDGRAFQIMSCLRPGAQRLPLTIS